MKYQWEIWTKRHYLRNSYAIYINAIDRCFLSKATCIAFKVYQFMHFPGIAPMTLALSCHDLQLKHVCVCLCQEWLASSCVLLGSPCVWLGLLNRSCIHRRSVRATWNPCRGSTASDARPRKSTSAKVSMCVCLSRHWFSVGLFLLIWDFVWIEQQRKVTRFLNRVTRDLLNVVRIGLFLCLWNQ